MHIDLNHRLCRQYVNKKQMVLSGLHIFIDHARLDAVKRYAKVDASRRLELIKRKVVFINKVKAGQEEVT